MILNEIGLRLDADKSSRMHNYLDFYEEMLPGQDFTGRLLEIGVMDGLSMRMWREYYPMAEIVGIDIFNKEHLYSEPWDVPKTVRLVEGNATKKSDTEALGVFDIILDDGSHTHRDQQKAFLHLYKNQLSQSGLYIIEDLWTSHMGGHYANAKQTTLEWLKGLEKKGVKMTYYRHKHEDPEKLHPEYRGLDSESVIIPGGQKI